MVGITSTIHVSNACSLNPKCAYCGFAAGTSKDGYFSVNEKTENEVKLAAKSIALSGINRVSLSAGYGNFERIAKALEIVKKNTDLKVLVNIGGDLNRKRIRILKELGVDTICCNLETVNESLFRQLKPADSLSKRLSVCYMVKEEDIELSSGILAGIGETEGNIEKHIEVLRDIKPFEVPIMGFRPYRDTPMEDHPPCPLDYQLHIIDVIKGLPFIKRITVPYPTIGLNGIIPAVEHGANNIATVIPENYPLKVVGVGSPQVGLLSDVLSLLRGSGFETDVGKPASKGTSRIH